MTTPSDTPTVPLPYLHLNGSGAQALLDQLGAVYHALDVACNALADAAPHGRDYYPLGEQAYPAAHADFQRRLGQMQQLRTDAMNRWYALSCKAHELGLHVNHG